VLHAWVEILCANCPALSIVVQTKYIWSLLQLLGTCCQTISITHHTVAPALDDCLRDTSVFSTIEMLHEIALHKFTTDFDIVTMYCRTGEHGRCSSRLYWRLRSRIYAADISHVVLRIQLHCCCRLHRSRDLFKVCQWWESCMKLCWLVNVHSSYLL